jgi:hypothetical protein
VVIKSKTSACNVEKTSGNANNLFSISLMDQNLQCLRNKSHELEIMLTNELKALNILCCTEHWLHVN